MSEDNKRQLGFGDIVFKQGNNVNEIALLHSGSVELLSASKEYNNLATQILLRHSSRVSVLKDPGIIVGHAPMLSGVCTKTIRAISDCVISYFPMGNQGFAGIATKDPNMAASVLRQIYSRINTAAVEDIKYSKLYQSICAIADNLSLIYKHLSGSGVSSGLEVKANSLYENYLRGRAPFPDIFDISFTIADHSRVLSRRYELLGESVESSLNRDIVVLLKRLFSINKQIFNEAVRADNAIAVNACETLTEIYEKVLFRMESAKQLLDKELTAIIGDQGSWTDYLVNNDGFAQWENSGKLEKDFMKSFLGYFVKLNTLYQELTGDKLTAKYAGIKLIHDFYSKTTAGDQDQSISQDATTLSPQQSQSIEDLRNSLTTIFNFALVEKDFQNRFLKLLNDFRNSKDPLSSDLEGRKLRGNISKLYWDLYKQVYIRSKKDRNIPKAARMMLQFGFVDEKMLDPSQLLELNTLLVTKEQQTVLPIVRETEFVDIIYEGQDVPSITELGLTYEAYLREEAKVSSRKNAGNTDEELDDKTKIAIYEIEHRTIETAAVCSGSRATAFPILTNMAVRGNLSEIYCTKKKVEDVIKNILEVDFSLFYRETVFKIGESRELIEEEVLPYIVLLPIFGTKTLLWQEMSGTNKKSRSRIVVPIFFMGDLERSLAHTFACFRWELNRSIKGAMWADPIEGGVTGEYFDYVNTYKKNSKLSVEAKEKLAERFKSLRTNRDRFADDYIMWIFYEKNGTMKLNNLVREMFYKHVPMNETIREQLSNMPAFATYANRYRNIQKRTIENYERKFKKYQDNSGHYPPEIEKYFEYLKM